MKNLLFLVVATIFLVTGMLAVMLVTEVVVAEQPVAAEAKDEKRIPEKPGGIPHGLEGPYAECSDCHQLEIPPHPPLEHECLICHTQQIDEEDDGR